MAKGGELWDDSALVDAFDHAVAIYKAMHGRNTEVTPSEKEKEDIDVVGEEPISTNASDEHIEKDDNCTDLRSGAMEAPLLSCEERKTTKQVPLEESYLDEVLCVSESQTYSSDAVNADSNVSTNQHTWKYNELLRQYYELEEQSRNVLQQLHQTSYWNYQTPDQSSTYQQQQDPAYGATAPDPHCSTTQCSCCCLTVPLVSASCSANGQPTGGSACVPLTTCCSISLTCDQCNSKSTTGPTGTTFVQLPTNVSTNDDQVTKAAVMTAEGAVNFMRSTMSGGSGYSQSDQCNSRSTTCPTGKTFVQLPTNVSTNDDQVTKAAMMTAEGAVNFMRSTMSGGSGYFQRKEAETGKEESTTLNGSQIAEVKCPDSDLTMVLNAWYAAGFHTGRYLMQQSMKSSQ